MMELLNEYLDRVHAGAELKEQTKKRVLQGINGQAQTRMAGRTKNRRRRMAGVFAAAAACAALVFGGAAFYNTPQDYISLDINPSVELGINVFGRVVSVQGVNQDGKGLIANMRYWNQTVEQTVQALVKQAVEQNYLAADGSSVIAVTAESQEAQRALSLQVQAEQGAGSALSVKNRQAVLYGDTTGISIRNQAQEMGISPGKYRLILALQAMDPGISAEQYRDAKISDIMRKADDLMKAGQTAGQYGDVLQKMEQAMNQVRQNESAALIQQTQTQTSEQLQQRLQEGSQASPSPSQSANPEQEQNKNQGQPSAAAQEQNQNGNQASTQTQTASCTPSPAGSSGGQNQNSGSGAPQSSDNGGTGGTQSSGTGGAQNGESSGQGSGRK